MLETVLCLFVLISFFYLLQKFYEESDMRLQEVRLSLGEASLTNKSLLQEEDNTKSEKNFINKLVQNSHKKLISKALNKTENLNITINSFQN